MSTCALPPDIEALRATDPSLARGWRSAVRATLSPALADGTRIVGFDRGLGYLLRTPEQL
jgi:predicted GNAT superfamily acetyltransferase